MLDECDAAVADDVPVRVGQVAEGDRAGAGRARADRVERDVIRAGRPVHDQLVVAEAEAAVADEDAPAAEAAAEVDDVQLVEVAEVAGVRDVVERHDAAVRLTESLEPPTLISPSASPTTSVFRPVPPLIDAFSKMPRRSSTTAPAA